MSTVQLGSTNCPWYTFAYANSLRKNAPLFKLNFPQLCLSQACPGKMIILYTTNGSKEAFCAPPPDFATEILVGIRVPLAAIERRAAAGALQRRIFFNVSHVYP